MGGGEISSCWWNVWCWWEARCCLAKDMVPSHLDLACTVTEWCILGNSTVLPHPWKGLGDGNNSQSLEMWRRNRKRKWFNIQIEAQIRANNRYGVEKGKQGADTRRSLAALTMLEAYQRIFGWRNILIWLTYRWLLWHNHQEIRVEP